MSTSDSSCKDEASKSNDDDVCDMNSMLHNMSTADNKDAVVSVCANCGKDNANNICNKCKQVKYCNAVCKKVHKKKHKKDCEEHIRLAAEKRKEKLRLAAELHDEKLFKQPPPKEDCPICMERLPFLGTGNGYQSCCGKIICSGCIHAPRYDHQGNEVDNEICPFCRSPPATSLEECIERVNIRVKANDPQAMYSQGSWFQRGIYEFPQDYTTAYELWHRSGELGHSEAYNQLADAYEYGKGVEISKKKIVYYLELAAIGGNVEARYNLGRNETNSSNYDRAIKHYLIATRDGCTESLNKTKELYTNGNASREDYTKALQLYQEYLGEIKSDQRDKAAAANDRFIYY